jgi:ABC-type antimicrobial peptide transport system permease subunit
VKIAGIAADTDLSLVNPEDTRPFMVYTNFWQDRDVERYPVLLVRTSTNKLDDVAVRRIVDGGGREYVEQLTSVTGEIDNALIENRLLAYLAGAFSVLALVIAAVGLFGLLSYQVSTRTAEIGLRMALGAKRAQVEWLFLRQVAFLLAIGIAVGVAATVSLQKAIAGLLYGARASDLPLLALSIAVLTATVVVAAWIPVRRASIVDPARALHHD